jgi:putative transposase
VCFSVELEDPEVQVTTGKSVGLDFGMKQFLTLSDGTAVQSPLFFREYQNDIKQLNRELSRKKPRSNHRKQAKIALAKLHRTIAEKRRDFFFKLAHDLTNQFDFLFFEDLNMKGMQRRWGKKISDLAFSEFVNILEYVAKLKGKTVHFIDRFYPSSKTCSCCGLIKQDLSLKDREWCCEGCDTLHDRDYNASLNIHRVGASTLRLGEVRPSLTAIAA